ncbi:protein henna-like [Ptychodera flava]|uniref:protein henna-like n=1 Tax=Ptychodera flava TaxID=63121 RepID=UPI00396AABEC
MDETKTWRTVFKNLTALHQTHACQEFIEEFQLFVDNGILTGDEIPQLETVSNFLKGRTGFTLCPSGGLISLRNFFSGLAYRVFHTTQYIRHGSDPSYSPEPDICHELLGHVALLANPSFAQFSQEIGLASLRVSNDWMEKLGAFYLSTLEFGLCKENRKPRAFGGAVLSSYGELRYALSGVPEIRPFVLDEVITHPYGVSEMQTAYFLSETFKGALDKFEQFLLQSPRPFSVKYDATTQAVEVLNL